MTDSELVMEVERQTDLFMLVRLNGIQHKQFVRLLSSYGTPDGLCYERDMKTDMCTYKIANARAALKLAKANLAHEVTQKLEAS